MSGPARSVLRRRVRYHNPGLIRLRLPLPLWTDHVNAFLLEGRDGWTVVDTGIYTPETLTLWQAALGRAGIEPRQIRRIVVTHAHMDHVGAAGALQAWTGAAVLASEREEALWDPHPFEKLLAEGSPLHRFGMPPAVKQYVEEVRIPLYKQWLHPISSVESMPEGTEIEAGDDTFHVRRFPGHSAGHLCLYSPASGVLLAGDAFVAPNNIADDDTAPLAAYFATMRSLQALELAVLMPGHGEPFSRVTTRLGLIADHRRSQLQRVKDLCRDRTVYEIYAALAGHGAISEHFFGMGEVYYMLQHLVQCGEVRRRTAGGTWHYACA